MKIKTQQHKNLVIFYQLSISASETYNWAHRPGKSWPCSQISGKRLWIAVDQNGLNDLALDGKFTDIDHDELTAIVSDFLPDDCKHLWPCWN